MKLIGIIFIILGIISGLLGVRSYLRDDAYAKASVVVKSSVKWAEVKPNPWKSTVSIKLMLSYMRDGVPDSLEHNYSLFYSQHEPLPTVEQLKAATPYIRYVPKEKRSKNIPDWVMVGSKDQHDGVYGYTGFAWMLRFLLSGTALIIYSKVRKQNRGLSNYEKYIINIIFMNTFLKTVKHHLAIVVDFRTYYKKPNSSGLLLLLLFTNSLYAISPGNYPASTTPAEMLTDFLDGEYQASQEAVKWLATPGDVHEFNGQLGENRVLYSFIDTTMTVKRGNENVYYTVFRTSPMVTNEDGEFVDANSCHMCGVSLGYFSYTIENDSIYIQKFKRNFAIHGSFGEKSYTLSMINLGDGYELLKVDDPYEGMGINSVGTKFYREGELMLSMITEENNRGNRNRNQKGYYEFNTDFAYSNKAHSVTVKQTGYRIDELSGKRKNISKIRKIKVGDDSLQFQQ